LGEVGFDGEEDALAGLGGVGLEEEDGARGFGEGERAEGAGEVVG